MLLGSGNYFDYANPEAEDLTIEDYAYGLAFTGRFSGQCVNKRTGQRVFYSVAQHCEILSKLVPAELAYAALIAREWRSRLRRFDCYRLTKQLRKPVPLRLNGAFVCRPKTSLPSNHMISGYGRARESNS